MCVQHYVSLCLAVMICAVLVNTHTHRQIALTDYTISSANWTKKAWNYFTPYDLKLKVNLALLLYTMYVIFLWICCMILTKIFNYAQIMAVVQTSLRINSTFSSYSDEWRRRLVMNCVVMSLILSCSCPGEAEIWVPACMIDNVLKLFL